MSTETSSPRVSRRLALQAGAFFSLSHLGGLDLEGTCLALGGSALPTLRTTYARQAARHPELQAAVAVADLPSGRRVGVRQFASHHPGCTLNLLVLLCVTEDLAHNRYPESAVAEEVVHTIRHSSAAVGRELLIRCGDGDVRQGLRRVNRLAHRLGLRRTQFDHPPGYWQT